jgi:hypothetical protein
VDCYYFNNEYDIVHGILDENPDDASALARLGNLNQIPDSHDLNGSINTLKRESEEYDKIAETNETLVAAWHGTGNDDPEGASEVGARG